MNLVQGLETTDRPLQKAFDRTLYWTLSFYVPASLTGIKRACEVSPLTAELRDAIEPLFNDIADRSRRGHIEDDLFGAEPARQIKLRMPETIHWTTEGCAYSVEVPAEQRERSINLRRFFYQHGSGAISWHLSFDYFYANDIAREEPGTAPITWYFLSLLQKLAWPKEFRCAGHSTTDQLVGIEVELEEPGRWTGFWSFVEHCFDQDSEVLRRACSRCPDPTFDKLVEPQVSYDVPGLTCRDSRSLFFIHDKTFFDLIHPVKDGELVKRRQKVRDEDFAKFPTLIERQKARHSRKKVTLSDDYWREARPADDDDAEVRLTYLFLSGFNQNIIDFMNQEASEVLDSLDPIYPKSEDQEAEGFFVRYANPRSMITYVPRSRTLEVGNDYIGTCPYAFLIHALSMHNEALTRAQEKETFKAIKDIRLAIEAKEYPKAEDVINATRNNAFEIYDRHRYLNPFRYDTERDVFEALEQLRGTLRLKTAYEAALASLEEQAQDLGERRRSQQDRQMALLFGVLGVSGVIQVAFQVEQYSHVQASALKWPMGISFLVVPILLAVLLYHLFQRPTR